MNEKTIEFDGDQYAYERAKYACEKSGKNLADEYAFFLQKEVGPTADQKKETAP